jgi:homocysteine S-methyltransferase
MTTTPAMRLPQFITDGGIETHIIFNMGVDLPHFSAFPLNDSAAGREVIRRYYRDYLPVARAAGRSFLFATDSWRASPDWADRLGYDRGLLEQNNVTSAALCAELADEFAAAGVASAIAGIIGPRRDAWQYDAGMTVAEAHDYHSPQVEAFAGTAATSLHAYTLTNTPEAIGIARAAERAGLPIVLSFTVETDGALPGGKPLGVAIAEVDEATGGYPAYYMINCAHPCHFARELRRGVSWVRPHRRIAGQCLGQESRRARCIPRDRYRRYRRTGRRPRGTTSIAAQSAVDRRLLRHRSSPYRRDLCPLPQLTACTLGQAARDRRRSSVLGMSALGH